MGSNEYYYSRDVLVLAKQRQVEQNLQRLSVRCHDDELTNPAIQSFGRLVRALLELLVVAGLPNK